jgi:hypothetical protein
VSSQLHAPTASPPTEKKTPVPIDRFWVSPRDGLGVSEKRKNSYAKFYDQPHGSKAMSAYLMPNFIKIRSAIRELKHRDKGKTRNSLQTCQFMLII